MKQNYERYMDFRGTKKNKFRNFLTYGGIGALSVILSYMILNNKFKGPNKSSKALEYLEKKADTLSVFIEPGNPSGVDQIFNCQKFDSPIYTNDLRGAYWDLYCRDNHASNLDLRAGLPVKNYNTVQDSIDEAIARYTNEGTEVRIFRIGGKDGSEKFRENHQRLLDKGFKPVRSPRNIRYPRSR